MLNDNNNFSFQNTNLLYSCTYLYIWKNSKHYLEDSHFLPGGPVALFGNTDLDH